MVAADAETSGRNSQAAIAAPRAGVRALLNRGIADASAAR
jgi:hypothetical protein